MDLQIRGLYSQRYTANTWRYLQRASSEVHLLYSTQFQFTTDTRNNWHMWMGWASCSRRTEPGQKRGTQQWNCLNVIASNFYFQQSSKTTVNSHRVVIRFRTKKNAQTNALVWVPVGMVVRFWSGWPILFWFRFQRPYVYEWLHCPGQFFVLMEWIGSLIWQCNLYL